MAGSDWDVPMTLKEVEEIDGLDGGDIIIYPYKHTYSDDYLFNFSKISIEKYNQDTGKRYAFVELEEARMNWSPGYDSITAYFKARRPDDKIVTTFVATTDCPTDKSVSDPHPESIKVFPLAASHTSSSQDGDPAAENLEAQVELLKVSSCN